MFGQLENTTPGIVNRLSFATHNMGSSGSKLLQSASKAYYSPFLSYFSHFMVFSTKKTILLHLDLKRLQEGGYHYK